jgi:hypothetical protein
MNKFIIIATGFFISGLIYGQEPQISPQVKVIDKNKLVLRPNSRDYAVVRRDNNHRHIVHARRMTVIRNRQAIMNRRLMMRRRQQIMNQRMIRMRRIRQQMIQRRQRMSGH